MVFWKKPQTWTGRGQALQHFFAVVTHYNVDVDTRIRQAVIAHIQSFQPQDFHVLCLILSYHATTDILMFTPKQIMHDLDISEREYQQCIDRLTQHQVLNRGVHGSLFLG